MKYLQTIIILFYSIQLFSQPVFNGLLFGMTEKEAKSEFKANTDVYTNVDLGNGFVWRVTSQNFLYDNKKQVDFNDNFSRNFWKYRLKPGVITSAFLLAVFLLLYFFGIIAL